MKSYTYTLVWKTEHIVSASIFCKIALSGSTVTVQVSCRLATYLIAQCSAAAFLFPL